jgi:hypothetical protein
MAGVAQTDIQNRDWFISDFMEIVSADVYSWLLSLNYHHKFHASSVTRRETMGLD